MPDPTQRDALEQAISDHPTDTMVKRIYADWLEECGELDLAFAYRWAAQRRKHPWKGVMTNGYAWWGDSRYDSEVLDYAYALPQDVVDALQTYVSRSTVAGTWVWYDTVPDAFTNLAIVLRTLKELLR